MRRLGPLFAAVLVLLVVVLPVDAAGARLSWARPDSSHVTVALQGRPATGAWRVDLIGTGRALGHTLRVDLIRTRNTWTGTVALLERRGSQNVVVSSMPIDPFLGNATATFAIHDPLLGATASSGSITAPAHGDATLRLTFAVTRGTHYALTGALRSETAHRLGPWVSLGACRI